jgi:hypothetical protein
MRGASVGAFAILLVAAIVLRRRPDEHKRLMLLTSISIVQTALVHRDTTVVTALLVDQWAAGWNAAEHVQACSRVGVCGCSSGSGWDVQG